MTLLAGPGRDQLARLGDDTITLCYDAVSACFDVDRLLGIRLPAWAVGLATGAIAAGAGLAMSGVPFPGTQVTPEERNAVQAH